MMAVRQGHNEVADVLLEAGADVNLQSNDVSWQSRQPKVTTFTRSSVSGKGRYSCIIHFLLLQQKERRTALMLAAKSGTFSIVKLLLKHKPDVNIKDSVSLIGLN